MYDPWGEARLGPFALAVVIFAIALVVAHYV